MSYEIAIKPQPGSQSLALSCPCNEILYEGTRGPGKTAAQLMRFRRNVGVGYGAFWKGVIFDIEYKNLGDIIAQSKKIYNRFNDGAKFLSSPSDLKWVWPTGEELLFRYERTADGYWNYHGQEFPFIGHNELSKRANSEFYESMFSCMRTSFRPEDYPLPDGGLLPPIPLESFSTTNPYGVGHNWIKKRFIDPMARGKVLRTITKVEDPETEEEKDIELTRVAIHGNWRENKFLPPEYIALLKSIKDPNKRAAWVDGSWDITSGGRFDHLWDAKTHIIKPFKIPKSWRVDRGHDWGESKPFSNLWFAESDGTEATLEDGKKICPPRGTVFVIGELYGCPPDLLNEGLNMSAHNVGKMVMWVDSMLLGDRKEQPFKFKGQCNIIPSIAEGRRLIMPGPADNAIFNKDDEQISIADKMKVDWLHSDKSPGSRVAGAAVICEMLEAAIEAKESQSGQAERPALYFFENCRGIISRFPVLARDSKDPDDIDTEQEDHDYDVLRYRLTVKNKKFIAPPTKVM